MPVGQKTSSQAFIMTKRGFYLYKYTECTVCTAFNHSMSFSAGNIVLIDKHHSMPIHKERRHEIMHNVTILNWRNMEAGDPEEHADTLQLFSMDMRLTRLSQFLLVCPEIWHCHRICDTYQVDLWVITNCNRPHCKGMR